MISSKYSETAETIGKIEFEPMPIQIDIRKTLFYKWGEKEGEKRGEKRGILKGLKEGLKEGILGIIRAKFGGQKAKQFKNFLGKVDDINHLKKIKKKIKKEVIRARTWEDFIKIFKNSNSKNKNSKRE